MFLFSLLGALAAALLVASIVGVLAVAFFSLLPIVVMVGGGFLLFRAVSGGHSHGLRTHSMRFGAHGPGRVAAPVEQGIFCPSCNQPVSRQWATCPHCGYRKYLAPDLIQRRCATCSTELQKDWNACPYCSTRIDAPLTAAAPGPGQFQHQTTVPVYAETASSV